MEYKPIQVLLAKDNPSDTRLLQEMLAEANPSQFELTHVGSLRAALQSLDETRFDLLVLDLSLPDGQGFDTFAGAYAQAQGVPIIVMTGFVIIHLLPPDLAIRWCRGQTPPYLALMAWICDRWESRPGDVNGNPGCKQERASYSVLYRSTYSCTLVR